MDHLASVDQPFKPIVVPYLGGTYNGRGFTESLEPGSVDLAVLRDANIPIATKQAFAPLLQSWFFFGLLHEVLGLDINQDDFIVEEKGRQVISTKDLKAYLSRWKAANSVPSESRDEQARRTLRNERIKKCLRISYDTWQSIPNFTEVVGSEVELSIHILAATLEFAVDCALGIHSEYTPWRLKRNDHLSRLMVEEGWCPALVWGISGQTRLVWQYYCRLLGPPRHRHRSDMEVTCKAGDLGCSLPFPNSSNDGYQQQHVCPEGSCDDISPWRMSTIESTVGDGGIPLLNYDPDTRNLVVKKYERGDQYTAISHVWSDGLGNPGGNTMPQCQLQRLCNAMRRLPWTNKCYVASLDEDLVWQTNHTMTELTPDQTAAETRPLLFWIDTICVPKDEGLRKIAINNMGKVYNRANRVLVFDSDLTGIRGKMCPEEIFSRISISSWLRRFWTLQEAVLAKVLWFQFRDEAYRDMSHLNPEQETAEALFDNEIGYYCKDFNFNWRLHANSLDYTKRVAFVWDALAHRTSTFKDDQPICIATLLDMPATSINHLQDFNCDERFEELWFLYDSIPTAILFKPGLRLQKRHLNWAPSLITSLGALPPPGLSSSAIPTRHGLEVTHHGIITTEQLSKPRHGVIAMRLPDNTTYLIRENIYLQNPPWNNLDFTTYTRLAVLISQAGIAHEDEREPLERSLGALVGIDAVEDPRTPDEEGSVIRATYLRAVSVLLQGSRWETVNQREWTEEEEREKSIPVQAEWTPARQRWVIS